MADLEEICNLLALCIAGFAIPIALVCPRRIAHQRPSLSFVGVDERSGQPDTRAPNITYKILTISPVLKDFGHNSFRVYVCMATPDGGKVF